MDLHCITFKKSSNCLSYLLNRTIGQSVVMTLGLCLIIVIGIALVSYSGMYPIYVGQVAGFINSDPDPRKAPTAVSGDNVYVVWSNNNTGNDEVMFRASTDGGTTFSDKINLSNTTNSGSQDAEIAADGINVIVTWWERNQTNNEPVIRVSTDAGKTFGPLLKLGANGTLGSGEAKPII